MSGPNKGPQGKDQEGGDSYMPEPQERYEEDGGHVGVTNIPSLEPFELKAPESDHTPNHTRAPKEAKTEYGHHTSGSSDGMYPIGE